MSAAGGGRRPRSRPRRATSAPTGGPPADSGAPGGRSGGGLAPGALDRSLDDTDTGWGAPPPGPDDDRILRERPPHWG